MYESKYVEQPEYNVGFMIIGASAVWFTLRDLGVPVHLTEAGFFATVTMAFVWAGLSIRSQRKQRSLPTTTISLLTVLVASIGLLTVLIAL